MASAFAQGFQMGGDMYDSAERMKLAKEQQQWAREEAEAKRANRQLETDIRTAGKETLGMAGRPVEYQGGEMGPQPEAAQTALRSDIATAPAKMYSDDQAQQDYLRRLRGLDVAKAQQYEKGALELGELKRGVRYADKQELALNFSNTVLSDLKNAKGDISAVIEKHFIPLYNEDKLPGFKDGGKAKIIPSAVGSGKSVLFTYKDGKQEVMPVDLATLEEVTKYTQKQMMASSSPENYWKSRTQDVAEKNAESQATSAGAAAKNADTSATELKEKIKADLFGVEARLKGAQATSALASAEQSRAHAGVYKNMVELANNNKEAGLAVKDAVAKYEALSPEDKKTKGLDILAEGALAASKKTGDITSLINILKKPDKSGINAEWTPIEAKLIEQGAKPEEIESQRTQFMVRRGFAPGAALAVIEGGINPQTKKPLTEADINAFNSRYPNSAVDKAALPWLKKQRDYEARVNAIPR